uniref:Uncharacterized protein n=1 Tax=Ditylenchus dipsaci TaxID=166011 RepID=A0A915EJJ7_9BILA
MHLSSRGLSLLHSHLWNYLLQPSKQVAWIPLVRPLYCPRPKCPFLVTSKNVRFCSAVREPSYGERDGGSTSTHLLLLGLLTMSIVMYVFLFLYIACS